MFPVTPLLTLPSLSAGVAVLGLLQQLSGFENNTANKCRAGLPVLCASWALHGELVGGCQGFEVHRPVEEVS